METRGQVRGEVITELAEVAAIEDEWRRLAELRGNAFLTPEWYRAWVEDAEEQSPLVVVARRDDGPVAGVMPLVVDRSHRPRALRYGGAGYGDRFGVAARPKDEAEVAAAAMRALEGALPRCPMLVLQRIDLESEWPAAMVAASGRSLATVEESRAELPHTTVKGLDWEGYLKQRSVKFRQRVGRGLERALKEDGVPFSVRETADPAALPEDLTTLFRLHALRHPGQKSSIAQQRVRDGLSRFAAAALERGWLRMRVLEIEGQPAAATLCWHIGPGYAFYTGGFDPAWSERSPGLLMMNLTVRAAIEEDAEDIDLLLGSEAYKWRFAPDARQVHTVILVGAARPTRLLVSGEAAARRYGRWLQGLPGIGRVVKWVAAKLPGGRR
jgi:CelD/BcsL family acetyltransferase involved in cellulose biosynthesis